MCGDCIVVTNRDEEEAAASRIYTHELQMVVPGTGALRSLSIYYAAISNFLFFLCS